MSQFLASPCEQHYWVNSVPKEIPIGFRFLEDLQTKSDLLNRKAKRKEVRQLKNGQAKTQLKNDERHDKSLSVTASVLRNHAIEANAKTIDNRERNSISNNQLAAVKSASVVH